MVPVIYYAENFPGGDFATQINNCIYAVGSVGGGECNAQGLGGTRPVAHTQISLSAPAGAQVLLRLPQVMSWTWDIADGASCGIKQSTGTVITNNTVGGGGVLAVLGAASSSTSMRALYCTDSANPNNYIRAEGFNAMNTVGASFSSGVVSITGGVDESSWSYITAVNFRGDAIHVSGCCGGTLDHVYGYASIGHPKGPNDSNDPNSISYNSVDYSAGGVPLTVDGAQGFQIANSTFNAPRIGMPNILVQGGTTQGLLFSNIYMEANEVPGGVDNTPMVRIMPGALGVRFMGGTANGGCATTDQCGTKPVFENQSWNGFSTDGAMSMMGQLTYAINEVTAGLQLPVVNGTVPAYAQNVITQNAYVANLYVTQTMHVPTLQTPIVSAGNAANAGLTIKATSNGATDGNSGFVTIPGANGTPCFAVRPDGTMQVGSDTLGTSCSLRFYQATGTPDAAGGTLGNYGYIAGNYDNLYIRQLRGRVELNPEGDIWENPGGVWRVRGPKGNTDVLTVSPATGLTTGSFQVTLPAPANSSSPCAPGQFTDDDSFHYVCTAPNTWKRVALSPF